METHHVLERNGSQNNIVMELSTLISFMGTQVWKIEAVLKEKISNDMPIQYMT